MNRMKQLIRRAASLVLALVLMLSVPVYAFAAGWTIPEATRTLLNSVELSPEKASSSSLDKALQQILSSAVTDETDPAGQLKACFDFVVRYMNSDEKPEISYRGRDWFPVSAVEAWAEHALVLDFGGSCPEYSALFLMLARKIGYSGQLIVGETPRSGGGMTGHKWVELNLDGSVYVFDPYLEQNFVAKKIASPGNFFCTTYDAQPGRFVKYPSSSASSSREERETPPKRKAVKIERDPNTIEP